MKVALALVAALVIFIALPGPIHGRGKKPKFCKGEDSNRYEKGESYEDEEACIRYTCIRRRNKFKMKKEKIHCSGPEDYVSVTALNMKVATVESRLALLTKQATWEQTKSDDCWSDCGKKTGPCPSFCGSNGYCCRKGFDGCPPGAGEASPIVHTCVREKGKLWRDDGRCGHNFPLTNGDDGQCDPKGNGMTAPWGPCCSGRSWCGNTDAHCKCATCVDYSHSNLIDGTCYADDRGSRLLPHYSSSTTNTPEECKRTCGRDGYLYAGVQWAKECWCGNDKPPASKIQASSQCNMDCTGDASQKCGSSSRMNIYRADAILDYVSLIDGPGCGKLSIRTSSECGTAASSLGFSQNVQSGNWNTAPPGCMVGYPSDWKKTFFNTHVTGTIGNNKYKSLCHKGAILDYVSHIDGPGCGKLSIMTSTECGIAASSLSFSQNVQTGNWNTAPPGCMVGYPSDWKKTFFNTHATGTTGKNKYKSLCHKGISTTTTTTTTITTTTMTTTKTTTTTTTTTPDLIDGTCYADDKGSRLLPHYSSSTTNTPEECKKTCGRDGYLYAGVQWAKECWCGNDKPPASKIQESSQCNMDCTGDASQKCGGSSRMNIYRAGISTTTTTITTTTTTTTKTTTTTTTTTPGCSSGTESYNISNTKGMNITSPNYSGNYPDNSHCKWIFTAPPGEKVSFTILDIDTEFGYDIIQIFDEIEEDEDKAPFLATLSGTDLQEAVISSGEKMRVTFISDENVNRRGFKATLKTLKQIVDTGMCSGDYYEAGRPPAGTKCIEKNNKICHNERGRWGKSWCHTGVGTWGAECVKCSVQMCTGVYSEPGRPPAGTKCVEKNNKICHIESGRWGKSWCHSEVGDWGAECVKCSACNGIDAECCTAASPCGLNDGDCDEDFECLDGLVCGKDNCPHGGPTWDTHDDCCTYPDPNRRSAFNIASLSRQKDEEVTKLSGIKAALQQAGVTIDKTFTVLTTLKPKAQIAKNVFDSFSLPFGLGDISSICSRCQKYIKKINDKIAMTEMNLGEIGGMLKTMEDTDHNMGGHYLTCIDEALTKLHNVREEIKPIQEDIGTFFVADIIKVALGPVESEINTLVSYLYTISQNIVKVEGMIEAKGFLGGKTCNAGQGPDTSDLSITSTVATSVSTAFITTSYEDLSTTSTIATPVITASITTPSGGISIMAALKEAGTAIESTSTTLDTLKSKVQSAKNDFGNVLQSSFCLGCMEMLRKIENTILQEEKNLGEIRSTLKTMEDTMDNIGGHHLTCINEAITTLHDMRKEIETTLVETETFVAGLSGNIAGILKSALEPIKEDINTFVVELNNALQKLEEVQTMIKDMGFSTGKSCNGVLGPTTLDGYTNTTPDIPSLITTSPEDGYTNTTPDIPSLITTSPEGVKILGTYAGPAQNGQVLTFSSEAGLRGKYVVVQLGYTGDINLAEIEIRAEAEAELNQECSIPVAKENGNWTCKDDYSSCFLRCNPGFVAHLYSDTTCTAGTWKEINNMECLPSVFLMAGGNATYEFEIYHPYIGEPTCADHLPPMATALSNYLYASFYYHNTIYFCGQVTTLYTLNMCYSFNSKVNTWKTHTVRSTLRSIIGQSQSIRFGNKIYLFGGTETTRAFYTTLPLTDAPEWVLENSLSYMNELTCAIKMDSSSFVITGGRRNGADSVDVIRRNIIDGTTTTLSSLPSARYDHGCVLMEEEGKQWIVVAGGSNNGKKLKTAQKLDVGGGNWTDLGELNEERTGLNMIVSERGVMVMGGGGIDGILKTVELLNWTSTHWELVDPSLKTPRMRNAGTLELPASLFSCETQAIKLEDCEGEYLYNTTYEGGDVVTLKVNETCHSLCQSREDCQTWTWTPQQEECRIQTSQGSNATQIGSVSGAKNACKPKCYLVIGESEQEEVNTNTQFCPVWNTIASCVDIIHMEPNDFETSSEILVCYEGEGVSHCEHIEYEDADLICNPEPGIVTLSTWQKINKHRYYGHLKPYFGYRG